MPYPQFEPRLSWAAGQALGSVSKHLLTGQLPPLTDYFRVG